MPLSRELDPLFRSEVRKPPIRNGRRQPLGRIEHLAGLGAVVRTRGWIRLGSPGQSGGAVRIEVGAIWRFRADGHARFLERMGAPGRPAEPQSAGGEQRRYCQGQRFCFHCFLGFDSSFTFIFAAANCARILGSWRSIWNEGGEFWCETAAGRNEPDPEIRSLETLTSERFDGSTNRYASHCNQR